MEETKNRGDGGQGGDRARPTFADGAAAQFAAEWAPKDPAARAGACLAHGVSVIARLAMLAALGPALVCVALLALHAASCSPSTDFDVKGVGHFVQDGRSDGVLLNRANGKGAAFSVPASVKDGAGRNWKVVGISQCAFQGSGVKTVSVPSGLKGDRLFWCFEKSKIEKVIVPAASYGSYKRALERANPCACEDFEVVRG